MNGKGHKQSQAWVNQLPSTLRDPDWTGPATISTPGA